MTRTEFETAKAEVIALIAKANEEGKSLKEDADFQAKFGRLKAVAANSDKEKEVAALAIKDEAEAAVKAAVTQSFKKDNMETKTNESAAMLSAIRHFGRTGEKKYQEFALTSAGTSGILMPKKIPGLSVIHAVANAYRKGFAALNIPTFTTSSTENMTAPVFNDASNSANNDQEGATSGVNLDATYSASYTLNLVEYHSKAAWVTEKVANAEDFDITQYIYPSLLQRIERKEDSDWSAVLIADTGSVGKTTASATAVTLNELIDWDESHGAGYDGMPKFYVVSSALRVAIRKLADTTNVPFFKEGLDGSLSTLFGKPMFVSGNMEVMTTGKVPGALICVDGLDGAVIRDTTLNKITRYENVPAYPFQVGYEAFGLSAFGYNASAIKTLKMA
jgi:HK97 family phage major capsid protein